MIGRNSVLALSDSFVTVSRLTNGQLMRGYNKPTKLLSIFDSLSNGVYIETKYYSIIVSPEQLFIVAPKNSKKAVQLSINDRILTVDGFQPLTNVKQLLLDYEMANIITENGILISEGFFLLNGLNYGSR